jgi:hypothetical protein
MKKWLISLHLLPAALLAQEVPASLFNITGKDGQYAVETPDGTYQSAEIPARYTLQEVQPTVSGTEKGLHLKFPAKFNNYTVAYGFIPYGQTKFPQPIYFKKTLSLRNGVATIDFEKDFPEKYDIVQWKTKKKGVLGYRLIAPNGQLVYEGKIAFSTEPFAPQPTIIEGPFLAQITDQAAVVRLRLNEPSGLVVLGGTMAQSIAPADLHEITIPLKQGLNDIILFPHNDPDNAFEPYGTGAKVTESVESAHTIQFSLTPAPKGKSTFTFGYGSDSRQAQGGGERNMHGVNFYIVKRMMALAQQERCSFVQFTGDLIDGYLTDEMEYRLQLANWKRAIEPFAHNMMVVAAPGNHEALSRTLMHPEGYTVSVDRFPYDQASAEAVYADEFTNPTNGPVSEDGSPLDPNKKKTDFPPYRETAFWYQYGQVAMVVLNSNYWYTVQQEAIPQVGGNPHAYVMDQQLAWLKSTIEKLEKDAGIDHIFVTIHTPFFPNGGHVQDDMWYNGNNSIRPYVAGKPAAKGIIERRDEMLQLLVNQSTKVRALLTGDEHNYNKTEIGPETDLYGPAQVPQKITLSRTIWQINNGAAGAPYYAQEQTPWTPKCSGFSTQNALVLFEVSPTGIAMRVINPDTLEELDSLKLY